MAVRTKESIPARIEALCEGHRDYPKGWYIRYENMDDMADSLEAALDLISDMEQYWEPTKEEE